MELLRHLHGESCSLVGRFRRKGSGAEQEFHQVGLRVELHFNGGVSGDIPGGVPGGYYGDFPEDIHAIFHDGGTGNQQVKVSCGANDGDTFAIIAGSSGFLDKGKLQGLFGQCLPDGFRIRKQSKVGGGNMMEAVKFFLQAFVLDDSEAGGGWEYPGSFLFQSEERFHIHMFDFDGQQVNHFTKGIDVVEIIEVTFDEVIADGRGGHGIRGVECPGVEVPIVGGERQHLAELARAKNSDFGTGRFHGNKNKRKCLHQQRQPGKDTDKCASGEMRQRKKVA